MFYRQSDGGKDERYWWNGLEKLWILDWYWSINLFNVSLSKGCCENVEEKMLAREEKQSGAFWTTHHASIWPNKSLWCVCGRLLCICFSLFWHYTCRTFNRVTICQIPIKKLRTTNITPNLKNMKRNTNTEVERWTTYLRGETSEILSVPVKVRTTQTSQAVRRVCVCVCTCRRGL